MPVASLQRLPANTTRKISEVNPLRETLTVVNYSPFIFVIADDDAPILGANVCHGIPVFPYSRVTLEKQDGDRPENAWYIHSQTTTAFIVFEGMQQPKERRWF